MSMTDFLQVVEAGVSAVWRKAFGADMAAGFEQAADTAASTTRVVRGGGEGFYLIVS